MDATAVVTGGTDGVGRAVAAALAGAGARVVVSGRDADAVAATAADLPGEATGLRADVRDEFDVERLMETAARFGPGGVEAVVPCERVRHGAAGGTALSACSYAAFDDALRTNARGVFAAIREALPHMPPDGRVAVPTGGLGSAERGGTSGEEADGGDAFAVSTAAAAAVVRGFAADCEQVVGCVDPGHVPPGSDGEAGRDLAQVGELFLWALTDAPERALDGGVLTTDDWQTATG